MSWQMVLNDPIIHADTTATSGQVPTTPIIGAANGWTDMVGNIYNIASNAIVAIAPPGSFATQVLLRPSGEINGDDQRIVFSTTGTTGDKWAAVLRWVSAQNFYLLEFNDVNHDIRIYSIVGGSATALYTAGSYPGVNSGNTYTVDFSVVGKNPTTLSVTIDNATTTQSGYPLTFSYVDNTSALQVSNTRYGLDAYNSGAHYHNIFAYQAASSPSYSPSLLMHA